MTDKNGVVYRVGLGEDSHRFEGETGKDLVLGGVVIPSDFALMAESDGDVVLHAIIRAIGSLTGLDILSSFAKDLAQKGVVDSSLYLKESMLPLKGKITQVSLSIEAKKPRLQEHIPAIQKNVANLLNIQSFLVGITAHTGEGLSDFGRGKGIKVTALVTIQEVF